MIGLETNRIVYKGDGITKEFPFTFTVQEKTDMIVTLVHEDGTNEVLTKDYFVDLDKKTVDYPGYAPGEEPAEAERPEILPTGAYLVLHRDIPITQETYLGDKWPWNVNEDELDKITMILQDLKSESDRHLTLSPEAEGVNVTLPSPKANMGFYWDETGTKLVEGMNPKEATERAEDAAARAKTSEEKAEAAATRTEELAEKVFEGIDEAKQAAKDARASADEAAESAELAKQRADSIKGDTEKAAASAKAAQESADFAKEQADNAASSASRAAVNAQAAQWARDDARESAEKAKTSETNAKQSAQEAYYSARDALQSEINSARNAESAERSADSARNSAVSAKMSEIEAKSSADEAKEAALNAKVSLNFRGKIPQYSDLPTDPEIGDWWFIEEADPEHGIEAGESVVWNGTEWVKTNWLLAIATDPEIIALFTGSVSPDEYEIATDAEIVAVCAGEDVDEGTATEYDAFIPALLAGESVDTGDATDADGGVEILF